MPTRPQALSAYQRPGDYQKAAAQLGMPRGQEVVNPTVQPGVHEWIKQRAASDAQMQDAARARDAARDAGRLPPAESGDTDILFVLSRQHDQVTALFKQLKAIPGVSKGGSPVHQSRRGSIADMIIIALSRHEAAEEQHFWPWVRSVLDDGDDLAAAAFEQEHRAQDLLAALGQAKPSEERFDDLALELDKATRKHVAFEDRVLLKLRDATSPDDRRRIGQRFLGGQR